MSRFFTWYSKTYRHWPYTVAFMTCALKGSITDSFTQKKIENHYGYKANGNKNKMDYKRNARFAAWSGAYLGSFQHWLYNIAYVRLFGTSSLMSKIVWTACDCFIHVPFLYYPCYHISKALMLNQSPSEGFKEYWDNKWSLLIAYWKLWIPLIFCVFFFLPMEFRVMGVAGISLIWSCILSYMVPMQETEIKTLENQQIQ